MGPAQIRKGPRDGRRCAGSVLIRAAAAAAAGERRGGAVRRAAAENVK